MGTKLSKAGADGTRGVKEAPVGEWQSPISSELIVSKTIKLAAPQFGPGGSLLWLESRPEEGGRSVIVIR